MTSVNTNYGALVALQSLTQTTRELSEVQNRVNTGLKVASAKDNGAVFAIAEGQRARVSSLSAVTDGIDRATSVIDVSLLDVVSPGISLLDVLSAGIWPAGTLSIVNSGSIVSSGPDDTEHGVAQLRHFRRRRRFDVESQ